MLFMDYGGVYLVLGRYMIYIIYLFKLLYIISINTKR